MTPKKLIRAMRARRAGKLACGHYALRGQLIVKVGGRGWVCAPCRLEQFDAITSERPATKDGPHTLNTKG